MTEPLKAETIWTDEVKEEMKSKSTFYDEDYRIYEFGYFDGYLKGYFKAIQDQNKSNDNS